MDRDPFPPPKDRRPVYGRPNPLWKHQGGNPWEYDEIAPEPEDDGQDREEDMEDE